jgi:thiamine biosynthesis lipoprotein
MLLVMRDFVKRSRPGRRQVAPIVARVVAATVALGLLAGCGGGDDAPPAGPYATEAVTVGFRDESVGGRETVRADADFVTMSTEGRLVVYADNRRQADLAVRTALDHVADLAAKLNRYDPASEVSAINAAAGADAVQVSDATGRAIEAARHWHAATNGAFHPLVGPLVALWKEAAGTEAEPADEAIDRARALMDMDDLECRPTSDGRYRVRLRRPGKQLDLGGLAKGWAASEAVAAARRIDGLQAVLVMLGGDGTVWSEPGWPRLWTVAVQDPRNAAQRSILKKLTLTEGSVVTSGAYYRYIEIGGRRFSHIIDPRTGRPTPSDLASATVIHRDGGGADALATACMVLGQSEAMALLARTAGAEGLLVVVSEGAIERYETPGLGALEIGR